MDEREGEIRRLVASTPIYALLGIELVRMSAGEAEARMKVDERHCNVDGVLHGGVVALLADTAMGCAARMVQEAGTRNHTIDLSTEFFSPGHSGDVVTARGFVRRRSGRFAWAEAVLLAAGGDGEDREIAAARSLNYRSESPA